MGNIASNQQKVMELKKHVAVIHSSNKLTLLQRKIANALLFNAYPELLDKEEHTIHIGKLCELIGYDSNDHKTLKRSLVNLLSTVLEWNLVDGERLDNQEVWNASSIIADAGIDGAICTYSYSNKMRKLLHRPQMYGQLNMVVQAKFKSNYGLALYENCTRFKDVGKSPWFDLSKFRKLMGVEDGQYQIFRDFKTRVLDKAVEEVNKYSPININPQIRRQNRKVMAIQFLIQITNNLMVEEGNTQITLVETLKLRFGLSNKQIDEVMNSYDEAYIIEKIAIIEASPSYKSGNIKNLAKYLMSALRDDYQQPKHSAAAVPKEKITTKQKDQMHLEEARRAQDKQMLASFELQDEKNKKLLLDEFVISLGKSVYADIYLREGLNNILIRDQLCRYLKHR